MSKEQYVSDTHKLVRTIMSGKTEEAKEILEDILKKKVTRRVKDTLNN